MNYIPNYTGFKAINEKTNFILGPSPGGDPHKKYTKPFFIEFKDKAKGQKSLDSYNKWAKKLKPPAPVKIKWSKGSLGYVAKIEGFTHSTLKTLLDGLDSKKGGIQSMGWIDLEESVNETSYDSYFMDKKVLGPNYKNSKLHIVAKEMFGKSNYMKLSKQQQAKVLATFPDIKESVKEGYADDAFETDWVQMQNNAKGLGGRPKGNKEIEIKSKDLKGTFKIILKKGRGNFTDSEVEIIWPDGHKDKSTSLSKANDILRKIGNPKIGLDWEEMKESVNEAAPKMNVDPNAEYVTGVISRLGVIGRNATGPNVKKDITKALKALQSLRSSIQVGR